MIKNLESIIPHLPIKGLKEGVHIRSISKEVQESKYDRAIIVIKRIVSR